MFAAFLCFVFAGVIVWVLLMLNKVADYEANGDFSTKQGWLNAIRRSALVQQIVTALRKLFR